MFKQRQQGFTLIEILIAVALIAVVYTFIPSDFVGSPRQLLEQEIEKISRAIRFAQNESVLRNTIVRVKLVLTGEEHQSYSVDFAPSDTLPLPELQDTSKMSIREREEQLKIIKNIDSEFTQVPELKGEDLSLSSNIIIQGVGLSEKNHIQTDLTASIYFYPTGEKDSAIIFLSSAEEIASLSIEDYSPSPDISFDIIQSDDVNYLERKIKELYEKWRDR